MVCQGEANCWRGPTAISATVAALAGTVRRPSPRAAQPLSGAADIRKISGIYRDSKLCGRTSLNHVNYLVPEPHSIRPSSFLRPRTPARKLASQQACGPAVHKSARSHGRPHAIGHRSWRDPPQLGTCARGRIGPTRNIAMPHRTGRIQAGRYITIRKIPTGSSRCGQTALPA